MPQSIWTMALAKFLSKMVITEGDSSNPKVLSTRKVLPSSDTGQRGRATTEGAGVVNGSLTFIGSRHCRLLKERLLLRLSQII